MENNVTDLNSKEKKGRVYRAWTEEQRQEVIAFANRAGIKPAGRHFGCAPSLIREWIKKSKLYEISEAPQEDSHQPLLPEKEVLEDRLKVASNAITLMQRAILKAATNPVHHNSLTANNWTSALERQLRIEAELLAKLERAKSAEQAAIHDLPKTAIQNQGNTRLNEVLLALKAKNNWNDREFLEAIGKVAEA